MLLIGLTGYATSGIDATFKAIRRVVPAAKRFAFADSLKFEVSQATGVTRTQIEQQKDRFRPLLQWWGTEFRRHDDGAYWIKQLDVTIESSMRWCSPCPLGVITDVRFPDEADYVKSKGGVLVRVVRPGVEAVNGHVSEHAIPHGSENIVLLNDGSLDDLNRCVADFVTCLLEADSVCDNIVADNNLRGSIAQAERGETVSWSQAREKYLDGEAGYNAESITHAHKGGACP